MSQETADYTSSTDYERFLVGVINGREEKISELENELDRLRAEKARLREALKEIELGRGSFSMDPLEHCSNCLEEMKELARAALQETGDDT